MYHPCENERRMYGDERNSPTRKQALFAPKPLGSNMNRGQGKHQVYVRSVKYHILYNCASAPPVGNLSRGSLEDGRRSSNMCNSAARLIALALPFRGKPAHITKMEGKIYTPALEKKKKKKTLSSHISYGVIIALIQGSVLYSMM